MGVAIFKAGQPVYAFLISIESPMTPIKDKVYKDDIIKDMMMTQGMEAE